jgi:hypothetical protein
LPGGWQQFECRPERYRLEGKIAGLVVRKSRPALKDVCHRAAIARRAAFADETFVSLVGDICSCPLSWSGGRVVGEDVWFSNGVTQAGFEILCDGSVRRGHFKEGLDLLKLARW